MGLLTGAGKIAIKGATKLKGLFIKTSGKLGASAGKETAEELATQGGRTITREMAEQGIKKGSIKTEAGNLVSNVLGSKTARVTAKVGLASGGIATAGLGGSYAYDKIRSSLSQTTEQAQALKDIEIEKKQIANLDAYNKLMDEQQKQQLDYYKDYTKIAGKDNGEVMPFEDFSKLISDYNKDKLNDMNIILGGEEKKEETNNKWLYLLGGLGLVGAGYYIYKKGKKGKK